jgi:hypothetical protein
MSFLCPAVQKCRVVVSPPMAQDISHAIV